MKSALSKSAERSQHGFTYVELLVVLGLCLFCTVLILPTSARTRTNSSSAQCLNNLRQLSSAITMFSVDNNDTLPGSCWLALYGQYDTNTQLKFGLMNHIAPYLGAEPASGMLQKADVADCPSSVRYRKSPIVAHYLATNVSYQLPTGVTNDPANPPASICSAPVEDRYPFGYPSSSFGNSICGSSGFNYPGMKISNIKYPKHQWAMVDADALNSYSATTSNPLGVNYGQFLPKNRAHITDRNYLFFDGNAGPVKDF